MMSFKQFDEATIKWIKKPDGSQGSKKVYKHASADGNRENKLSDMNS